MRELRVDRGCGRRRFGTYWRRAPSVGACGAECARRHRRADAVRPVRRRRRRRRRPRRRRPRLAGASLSANSSPCADVGIGIDAGGIDEAERASAPVAERVQAVAGDAGVSSTIAKRWPISRLNRALLPTLGRPTMATVAGRSTARLLAGVASSFRGLLSQRAYETMGRSAGAKRTTRSLMASIYIETFGCQMNEADSQYVADRATSAGYAIATCPKTPTCCCSTRARCATTPSAARTAG